MPRPKIHATDAVKHAEYRKRRAEALETSRKVFAQIEQVQNAHRPSAGEQENEMQSTTWHEVKIRVDRPNLQKPALLRYIMSDEELDILKTDFANYAHSADAAKYGTYAYGESDVHIPGTISLAFEGMEITQTLPVPGFTLPPGYSISQGSVNIIRTPIKH